MTLRQSVLLGLLAALWGASYLLIKWALDDLSPAGVVCARTVLAAVVLLAVVGLRGAGMRAALLAQARRPGRALVLGAMAIAIPFGLISFGERAVPSGWRRC